MPPERADRHTRSARQGREAHRLGRGVLPALLDKDLCAVARCAFDRDGAVHIADADGLRCGERATPLPGVAMRASGGVEVDAERAQGVPELRHYARPAASYEIGRPQSDGPDA